MRMNRSARIPKPRSLQAAALQSTQKKLFPTNGNNPTDGFYPLVFIHPLGQCFLKIIAFLQLLIVATLFIDIFPLQGQSLEVPFLAGHVNDTAGMLTPATVNELEALLKAHEDSTSNQVVVLIIPGLQGEVLEEYSIRVVETWQLGQKDKDNGVLLLVSRDDRLVRIEVGNGLEGVLPDITCGRIIRNAIVPRFRDGDYDGGIRTGVNAILAAIRGAYIAEASEESKPDLLFRVVFFSIFILVVGVFTMVTTFSKGVQSWFLYFFLMPFWIVFPMVSLGATSGGILFALYVIGVGSAKIWLAHTKKGKTWLKEMSKKSPAFAGLSSSGSGRSSGGGWSSGGGGFSGGGGSFSGGGASGRW